MNEKEFHVGIKALVQNDEGKVLILKVNPEDLKGNKHGVYWDIPGGRIKEGDSVEETLKKELEEEIGTKPEDVEVVKFFHANVANIEIPVDGKKVGLVLLTYVCNLHGADEIKLSDEHTEYKWASVEEAKDLLGVKFSEDFIERLDEIT